MADKIRFDGDVKLSGGDNLSSPITPVTPEARARAAQEEADRKAADQAKLLNKPSLQARIRAILGGEDIDTGPSRSV